jgi:hypothetical protein
MEVQGSSTSALSAAVLLALVPAYTTFVQCWMPFNRHRQPEPHRTAAVCCQHVRRLAVQCAMLICAKCRGTKLHMPFIPVGSVECLQIIQTAM